MKVTEIFKTIQGEGILMGMVSVIVRLWGCNLKCRWCDERLSTNPKIGDELSIDEVLSRISDYDHCKYVIITGGEPLIHSEIVELTCRLKESGYHVTIETNATIQQEVSCDLVSMSPKLSNSVPNIVSVDQYNKKRLNIEVIKYYIANYNYQIKFVVGSEEDFNEVDEIFDQIGQYDLSNILIMPLASSRRQLLAIQKKIVQGCILRNWRYGNRLQLQVWGKNREIKT